MAKAERGPINDASLPRLSNMFQSVTPNNQPQAFMRRQSSYEGLIRQTAQVQRFQQFNANAGSCPNLSSIVEDSEGSVLSRSVSVASSSMASPPRPPHTRPRLQRSLSNSALDSISSSMHRMPKLKRNRSNSTSRHDMLPSMKIHSTSQLHKRTRRKSDPGNGPIGPMKSRELPKSFFEEPRKRDQRRNSVTGVRMEPLWGAGTIADPSSPRSRTSIPRITKAANTEQLWKLFQVLDPGDRAKMQKSESDLEQDAVLMSKFFELHFELNVLSNKLPVIQNSEFPSNFSTEGTIAPLNTTEALNNFVMTL